MTDQESLLPESTDEPEELAEDVDSPDETAAPVAGDIAEMTVDVPALRFVLTNNFNLTAALTKGVVETRRAFGDRKYYSDLFEECENYIVVVSEGFGRSLCDRVTRESEESYPVLLELRYDCGKLRGSWRKFGESVAVAALPGCMPLEDVVRIHFRREHDLKEYEAREYAEFGHPRDSYAVSPELFEGDGPDSGSVTEWLRTLPEAGSGSMASQVDRLAGAQCLVAWRASETLVHGLDGPALSDFLVDPYCAGTSTDVSAVVRATQSLVSGLADEVADGELESRLTEAAVKVLLSTDPEAKFRRRDVFKEVSEAFDTVKLAKKDKDRWDKVEHSLTAVLRDEADRPQYTHGESLLSAHALLATLQNHKVENHVKLTAADVGGSDEIMLVCAAFTGLLHGRAILDASYRCGDLDIWLALSHARATTPEVSPLTVFDSFRDLALQTTSQRGWKEVISWRGRPMVELPVTRPDIRDLMLGGSLASDVLEGALLWLAGLMGWSDVLRSELRGRGTVTGLRWEEGEFRASIASAHGIEIIPGVDVEKAKARLEETAELPEEVAQGLLDELETELRPGLQEED